MNGSRVPLILLVAVLLLTACKPTPAGVVQVPTFEVKDLKVVQQNQQLAFTVALKVHNPNPFDVQMNHLQGNWILNGKVSHALSLPDLNLGANSTVVHTVETLSPQLDPLKVARTQTFRLDGRYHLQALGQNTTLSDYTLFQGAFRLD